MLAVYLGLLGVDFTVSEPPELVERIQALGERYTRATGGGGPGMMRSHREWTRRAPLRQGT